MEIVITVNPDGKLSIQAPLEDKVFCLGILELAKQAVIKHKASAIQVAPAGVLV